jgi:hypothetical protein
VAKSSAVGVSGVGFSLEECGWRCDFFGAVYNCLISKRKDERCREGEDRGSNGRGA